MPDTLVTLRSLIAVCAAATVLLGGCARDVSGTAVSATATASGTPGPSGGECRTVDAPLADIPVVDDTEPRLRIPIPQGWERNSTMDSQIIRYAIVAQDLVADGFTPNAVVTLESVRGNSSPDQVFEQNRDNLVRMMNASDLDTETNTTCGFPSETTEYTAPAMGSIPQRPVIMHAVVATYGGVTHLATLTIQTTDPDNPTYQDDADEIVEGFQVVLP
ncbi:LpqN/LpqT family lipoprotein [Mycobacterium sp. Y57]|uniref:LpqN/LpqT family lipoprotein n=1 Tax=Mycolicibacterium xanthum TaxID=2796469 RepID=UPI001C8449BC|nr:LpqN/LpqT family lipoprotein [Mycolicibacterium xanthum]MBX7434816.1 LpqN/LpqT family lipoprotein [Mycolicibacterium xanthum]